MADEETQAQFSDWTPEAYEHRTTDSNGNPDDKLTEKEALAEAKEQGIEFVDSYVLVEIATLSQLPEKYETEKKAKAALKNLENKDKYTIAQTRERVQ